MELSREIENWVFAVTINSNAGKNRRYWTASTSDASYVDRIVELGRAVVSEARRDERLILDGINLKCSITEHNVQKVHEYRCPEQGTSEWYLAGAFLVRMENLICDQELINYIELLEGYFDRLPAKLFEENPRRLRIYGRLSVMDTKGLTDLIAKVANEQALIVDFTNFGGMGTILYKQFEPLKTIKNLKILVRADNEHVLEQVKEIGFENEQVIML